MQRLFFYPLLPIAVALLAIYVAWRDSPWTLTPAVAAVVTEQPQPDATLDPDVMELAPDDTPSSISTAATAADAKALATLLGQRLSRGLSGEGFNTAIAPLGVTAEAAIDAAMTALGAGNTSIDTSALKERMALIDFLGVTARHNATARRLLFDFALSTPPPRAEAQLLHLDVTDRLEAFVYVAAWAPAMATTHINAQPGEQLRRRFIVQFVAGREFDGEGRDDAIQLAYDQFANSTHQEYQP